MIGAFSRMRNTKEIIESTFVEEVDQIININSPHFESKTEEELVFKQIYGLFYYLRKFDGDQHWQKFVLDCQSTMNLEQSILNIYQQSFVGVSQIISDKLDKNIKIKTKGKPTKHWIDEYTILYNEDSNLKKDYPYIEYLLKCYWQGMVETFWINERIIKGYRQNINELLDQQILIGLLTEAKMIKQQFGKNHSLATTLFQNDSNKLKVQVLFKYYDFFAMPMLVVELIHLFLFLSNQDLNQLSKKKTFFSCLARSPLELGAAQFVLAKYDLLLKYKFIEEVDHKLANYFDQKGEFFDLNDLAIKFSKGNNQILIHEIAHSFFKYLVQNFGMEKALMLSYSTQKNEDYLKILGKNLRDLSSEWNEYIFSLVELK